MKTILILGGYGNFGKRIVEDLINLNDITLLVAGRNEAKAKAFIKQLPKTSAILTPLVIDINSNTFESQLINLSPDIVIHTSGPFQGQDYKVPKACIKSGAHYVDLADDRRFVCDIASLDEEASENNVLVVSGASSVPGLSAAVIDNYKKHFRTISSIDISIAPGNKAERGEATIKAILSYTGHSFSVFTKGKWIDAFGWMNARRIDFGDVLGKRWLANVDVPDLELFPDRYSVTQSVRFQAGLELTFIHLSMVFMAVLAKMGIVNNWSKFTKPIIKLSNIFNPFGTDNGGMQVIIKGEDKAGAARYLKWSLIAEEGVGPYIP